MQSKIKKVLDAILGVLLLIVIFGFAYGVTYLVAHDIMGIVDFIKSCDVLVLEVLLVK